MKLLYFVNSLTNSGGIERILVDKANYLATLPERSYEIHIAYYGKEGEVPFYRLHPDIRLHPIDVTDRSASFRRRIMTVPVLYRHMRRIIKDVEPDVIVNESMQLVSYILPFTFRDIPRIYVIHFSYEGLKIMDREMFRSPLKRHFMMWLRKSFLKRYDKFIVLTEHDRKMWNAPTVEVIPNFTNIKRVEHSGLSHKRAICVGRLEHQKDMPMLVRAWRLVAERYPDWVLDIWGRGSEYEKVKALVGSLHLEQCVFLRGTTQTVDEEYRKASLFVLASRYEGFALVTLEAMNMGLPCVSFDIPGCNNIIRDGFNGFIAKERTERAFADAILHYIQLDEDEKVRLQKNALDTCEEYGKDADMRKWTDLFEAVSGHS